MATGNIKYIGNNGMFAVWNEYYNAYSTFEVLQSNRTITLEDSIIFNRYLGIQNVFNETTQEYIRVICENHDVNEVILHAQLKNPSQYFRAFWLP